MEQCTKALEILTTASPSACLPVYKALAMFWLFMHKWKVISDKLSKDLEAHSEKVIEKKNKKKTEVADQVVEAEAVRRFNRDTYNCFNLSF